MAAIEEWEQRNEWLIIDNLKLDQDSSIYAWSLDSDVIDIFLHGITICL